MCLYPNHQGRTAVLQKFKRQRRSIVTFYKILIKNNRTLESICYDKIWKSGVNHAYNKYTKKKVKITDRSWHWYGESIASGIHVYTKKPILNKYYLNQVIVPVQCHKNDLMGASSGQAAFTKVFLEKKAFERAIRCRT